jgi:DNA polymerase III delta prime subunit
MGLMARRNNKKTTPTPTPTRKQSTQPKQQQRPVFQWRKEQQPAAAAAAAAAPKIKPLPQLPQLPQLPPLPFSQQQYELSLNEIVGQTDAIKRLQDWFAPYLDGKLPSKPMVVLYGKPGTGKTTTARAIAGLHNYDIIEINASDDRSESKVRTILNRCGFRSDVNSAFCKRPNIILFDEIDGMDKTGVHELVKFFTDYKKAERRLPIIATCNLKHGDELKILQDHCVMICFPKLKAADLVAYAQCHYRHSLSTFQRLAYIATGDIRRMRYLCEGYCGDADTRGNIFDVTKNIMERKADDQATVRFLSELRMGSSLVHANYLSTTANLDDIVNISEDLARMDMHCEHRIINQDTMENIGGSILTQSLKCHRLRQKPGMLDQPDKRHFKRRLPQKVNGDAKFYGLCSN